VKVNLNHGLKRVDISAFETEDQLIYQYFNGVPEIDRAAHLMRALHIGVLALEEDRIFTFVANTERTIGTELEALKMRYKLNHKHQDKAAVKGAQAEVTIQSYLDQLVTENKWNDQIALTGNAQGAIKGNKTGDILCTLGDKGEHCITIESKFDKGIIVGDLAERDWFGAKKDTVLGQLVEAKANRNARQSIIVLDRASISASVSNAVEGVSYRSPYGFIVIVDSENGDFENLGVAYALARELALSDQSVDFAHDVLLELVDRIISDANSLSTTKRYADTIITAAQELLKQIEKSRLSLEYSKSHLAKLLEERTLGDVAFHEFYSGGSLREEFKRGEDKLLAVGVPD